MVVALRDNCLLAGLSSYLGAQRFSMVRFAVDSVVNGSNNRKFESLWCLLGRVLGCDSFV
jgi:hypothetical protein